MSNELGHEFYAKKFLATHVRRATPPDVRGKNQPPRESVPTPFPVGPPGPQPVSASKSTRRRRQR